MRIRAVSIIIPEESLPSHDTGTIPPLPLVPFFGQDSTHPQIGGIATPSLKGLQEKGVEKNAIQPALHQASEEMVLRQLQGLIEICGRLSNSPASLQTLLDLSWGIGCIPKEKKFSKKWSAVISERHWLLLEDISRQIAVQFSKVS